MNFKKSSTLYSTSLQYKWSRIHIEKIDPQNAEQS